MKNYNRNARHSAKTNSKPLRTFVTVTSEECQGNPEKMVRRFIKKVKTSGVLEECRSRTHFVKPSEVRRMEKRETKRLIQKVNKQREELFKPRANSRKSFRSRR